MACEYPYGEQFWADCHGVSGTCRCDSVCSGSETKTRLRMPVEFLIPRPSTEWTEERIRAADDIPLDEKDEIIEYIQSEACLKAIDAPKVARMLGVSSFFEEIVRADPLLSPPDEVWHQERIEVRFTARDQRLAATDAGIVVLGGVGQCKQR